MDTKTSTAFLSQCAGKESFDKRSRAEKAAKRRTGRQVYRCPHCQQWHVGTKPEKKPPKEKGRQKWLIK